MAKRESLYKLTADAEAGTLTLKMDGCDEVIMAPFEGDRMAHLIRMAALHGLRQKIADKGALTAGNDGKVDQRARAIAVCDEFHRLRNGGEWNTGGGERGPSTDQRILIDALCMAKPELAVEDVTTKVRAMDVKTRTALLASEQLRVYVDEVREQMTMGVDLTQSLEAFGLNDGDRADAVGMTHQMG